MNALVSIRSNFLGQFSPTPEKRAQAAQQIAAAGMTVAETAKSAKSTAASATSPVNQNMDKDMFLRLLVSQMQNQDPMEPTDNAQMLAQLAQFTALEQMNTLNESFERLSGNIDQLNFISASSLVGHVITGLDENANVVQGAVSAVTMDNSVVYLAVGDKVVSMANVLSVGIAP
ncbi:MAG TPA: flagellar hook capping FlgD N-terminal domain-containing protein [Candidatus Hydrogenedentes bacterium]|nr:flagellar hook capping FlgD N-terminal domain-containing protein [Candidatus Hydrogenedentota bacterium]HOS02009.1 flagellar hook capping FlgD N-terminal domain-containing protein [Candidatus Hydrogenedentota bacterium]